MKQLIKREQKKAAPNAANSGSAVFCQNRRKNNPAIRKPMQFMPYKNSTIAGPQTNSRTKPARSVATADGTAKQAQNQKVDVGEDDKIKHDEEIVDREEHEAGSGPQIAQHIELR